jgi:hypothetical protein
VSGGTHLIIVPRSPQKLLHLKVARVILAICYEADAKRRGLLLLLLLLPPLLLLLLPPWLFLLTALCTTLLLLLLRVCTCLCCCYCCWRVIWVTFQALGPLSRSFLARPLGLLLLLVHDRELHMHNATTHDHQSHVMLRHF